MAKHSVRRKVLPAVINGSPTGIEEGEFERMDGRQGHLLSVSESYARKVLLFVQQTAGDGLFFGQENWMRSCTLEAVKLALNSVFPY